mmetsp:Transcript_16913/g.44401  ORF Transcript_16913/g.44401 Transcript_16913/m.44401 type:complete len:200 (-) Transcript_16913:247-846(-)
MKPTRSATSWKTTRNRTRATPSRKMHEPRSAPRPTASGMAPSARCSSARCPCSLIISAARGRRQKSEWRPTCAGPPRTARGTSRRRQRNLLQKSGRRRRLQKDRWTRSPTCLSIGATAPTSWRRRGVCWNGKPRIWSRRSRASRPSSTRRKKRWSKGIGGRPQKTQMGTSRRCRICGGYHKSLKKGGSSRSTRGTSKGC